ncbi:Triadin [Liparis tanakae]|uniref:Triadin n=1 Tax=Liparis tanakae TaxID=230148 RepID=A0A4Z2FSS8_9TELE|nr:Triadin [Liparis tanakae]
MTEAVEARSSTTTMVIDGRGLDGARGPKKTLSDDLHTTFSSPLAWILVLALVLTWSLASCQEGGLSRVGSDPVGAVNDAVEESTNAVAAMLKFFSDLVAPDEDEGNLYAVRKKGEFLPSRSKGRTPLLEEGIIMTTIIVIIIIMI